MHTTIKNRLAFSMLELIFVIVILGIVSSIGAEVIAKVYENYIVQRAQHRASIKSQIAINLIANRLRYVIPGTMVRRVGIGEKAEFLEESLTVSGDKFTVLQWVGTDGDSFEAIRNNGNRRPGWSGFCDLNVSTLSRIVSPGSNFALTNAIQTYLGRAGNGFSIFFPNDPVAHAGAGAGNTITLDNNATTIVERYKLAWSSYALVVEKNGDFNLYYNFAPTPAIDIGNTKSLLLKNVTNFKFERRGQTTRIKLCVEEDIGNGVSIPSCKEKAVF